MQKAHVSRSKTTEQVPLHRLLHAKLSLYRGLETLILYRMEMFLFCSQDGTCILYAARRGECVRTLRPPGPEPGSNPDSRHVINMVVSDFGDVVFFCKNGESRLLCRHSVNGKPLTCDSGLKNDITDFAVAGELLVTVDSRGRLLFRCLNTWVIVAMSIEVGTHEGTCCRVMSLGLVSWTVHTRCPSRVLLIFNSTCPSSQFKLVWILSPWQDSSWEI